jgi:hypothetical protein
MNTELLPAETISRTVCATTPWFLDADLSAHPDGWSASIRLNPTMARVRAEQQGLRDGSLAAAVNDARVRRMWDSYVARANTALPPDAQIVEYTPVFDEPLHGG